MSETTTYSPLILKENEKIAPLFSVTKLIHTLTALAKKVQEETDRVQSEFEAKKAAKLQERATFVKTIKDSGIMERFNAAKKDALSKACQEFYENKIKARYIIDRIFNRSMTKIWISEYSERMNEINRTIYIKFNEQSQLFVHAGVGEHEFSDYVKKELGLDWVTTKVRRTVVVTSVNTIQATIDKIDCYSCDVIPGDIISISFEIEYDSVNIDLFPG